MKRQTNFREELSLLTKNKNIYFFIGFLAKSLFNKSIFKKNETINIFLVKELKLQLKPYILSSRTLIVAFTIKHIINVGYKESMSVSLYNHILRLENNIEESKMPTPKNKTSKNNNPLIWIDKILGK